VLKTAALLRNEGSILLSERDVCAPSHETRQSTKEAPNFPELREGEVRLAPYSSTTNSSRGTPYALASFVTVGM
jgi:hypothetical protein